MTEENGIKPKKKSMFYPASFLVMTVTSLLFLAAVTGLGTMLIHYWLTGVSDIINDMFILYWIASVVVVTPLHLMAYRTVRNTDKSQVTTFSLRFAHGLLGAYLFIIVASYIALLTWLVAMWLNALLGTGEVSKHLLAASLSLLQAIIWLKYAATHFARLRTNESRPKYYIAVVSGLTAIILLLSFIFPVMAYRQVARDVVKERDLAQLQQAVNGYVDEHSTLPASLNNLDGLQNDLQGRLKEYQYAPRGETRLGVFGYSLCATFERKAGNGRDTGFGFASHAAGKQCFARATISFAKLNQELAQYAKNVANGVAKLQSGIQSFLVGAKTAVDQEITGVETFASVQIKQLETVLEGLEGNTSQLQQEMQRLEGNLGGLEGDTGQLAQDFAAVEQFFHDLGCLFGGCDANP